MPQETFHAYLCSASGHCSLNRLVFRLRGLQEPKDRVVKISAYGETMPAQPFRQTMAAGREGVGMVDKIVSGSCFQRLSKAQYCRFVAICPPADCLGDCCPAAQRG
jgi:hypothetical protein